MHLLNRRRIAEEGDRHLEALRRDVADGRLDVVRDPLNDSRLFTARMEEV